MNEIETKEKLQAIYQNIEDALENIQSILGTENMFLGELLLSSIPILKDESMKFDRLRSYLESEKELYFEAEKLIE